MSLRILGGTFKGHPLQSPPKAPTRPTQGIVRQAVFNICQQEIQGARFLDLFAGSGAMGLEALSRGAAFAVFVEQNKAVAQCIRENIARLHVEDRSRLFVCDIFAALSQLDQPFDIIYIDPPYHQATCLIPRVLSDLEKHLITPHGMVFVEESTDEQELHFESEHLKKKSVRHFGIARLHQFVN